MTDDPMLTGTPAEMSAYEAKIREKISDFVQQDRADRRNPPSEDGSPVIIGATGFGEGIKAF